GEALATSLLVCRVTAVGDGFSDGEQHYLPVLPSMERVTVTRPFTQNEAGTHQIDLTQLMPQGTDRHAPTSKLLLEYTNNPAWLMIQALPYVGKVYDDNAVSLGAAFYANTLGNRILAQTPAAKTAFQLWQQEQGSETSLTSSLEKNADLKDIVLNETPWVMDAENETEQKHRLADFFDENTLQQRLSTLAEKLSKLQLDNGAWTWWPGMEGSLAITASVSEMLVRLNSFGSADEMPVMKNQLDKAFKFMGREIIKEVEEMKRLERKGHKPAFPSFTALRWLYLCALDGRELPGDVQRANAYLMPLLKKDIHRQSLYEKAMTAVILSQSDAKRAKEYVKSLKEYTVYREEMGRYYDAPRAGYSWFDYRIPTQTMAIEALKRITPDDGQTISEMQRWLLQEKRTQAWDTPINSVNAVYAFLPAALVLDAPNAALKVDGKELAVPKATAALGYVKTPLPADGSTLTIEKTTGHTSWGAVYAQFVQPTTEVAAQRSGISVKREILLPKEDVAKSGESLSVGQRIVVRITIDSERDLDFVQVQDRRAACMEPVEQLSGYRNGAYCAPKDNATSYYFDCLRKGRHVIETEYYLDRAGSYETGTCIVQCAYAPEYRATAPASVLKVKK
ncbi:MAG: alpha-2-macroglobulin, partial [Prevotella sp.]|nr:alpha-2-macroglobulin [Prevotella sp.]